MAEYSAAFTGGSQTSKSKEARLLDILQRIRASASGYFAVHLHLSELKPSHRQPHFIRMAHRSIDSLVTKEDVQAFYLHNDDAILLCRNVQVDDVDDTVFRVRAIFHEDPLTQTEDGSADDRFSTWYDLAQQNDFKALEDAAIELAKKAAKIENKKGETSTGRASRTMQGEPLEPEMLTAINQKLLEARIGDLVRRQPAVIVGGKGKSKLAFREHFIAMEELRKRIAPKVNIFASSWLFQYLSETIDTRILEVMSRLDYSQQESPVSINLNIPTISARPFQNFHAVVGENTNNVVIEFQIIDIFSNIYAFNHARDWLQEHGYRVLIDGLNPLGLHFFDPSVLGADFMKMSWGPEISGGVGHDQTERIKEVVANMPSGGTVLARVDSEEGISWGLSQGIRCFQGHFTDKVVEAMMQKGAI